jgi:hypothetical protein
MATKIILKKSSTVGAVPLSTDLEIGEVAVNLVSRKLFTKNNSGNVIALDGAYVSTVAPGSPAEGDLWYDSDQHVLRAFNGATWITIGQVTALGFNTTTGSLSATNYDDSVATVSLDGRYSLLGHSHSTADITSFQESVEDIVGAMVTSNTESGITVEYVDSTGKLNFNVNDPTITLTGAVTGSATMTDLGNVSIDTTVNHTHGTSDVTGLVELIQDTTATALTAGGIVSIDYDDGIGSITISATETSTLNDVTTRGAITTNSISVGNISAAVGLFSGNVTISGNLTVNGTTTTVNSNEVNIGDAIILLNADEVGAPTQNAGFEIKRGSESNVTFLWDETNDVWSLANQTLADVRLDGGTY